MASFRSSTSIHFECACINHHQHLSPHIGPAKSTCYRAHGLVGHFHDEVEHVEVVLVVFCSLHIFLPFLRYLGPYDLRSCNFFHSTHARMSPCSSLNTYSRLCVGITTRFPHKINPSCNDKSKHLVQYGFSSSSHSFHSSRQLCSMNCDILWTTEDLAWSTSVSEHKSLVRPPKLPPAAQPRWYL